MVANRRPKPRTLDLGIAFTVDDFQRSHAPHPPLTTGIRTRGSSGATQLLWTAVLILAASPAMPVVRLPANAVPGGPALGGALSCCSGGAACQRAALSKRFSCRIRCLRGGGGEQAAGAGGVRRNADNAGASASRSMEDESARIATFKEPFPLQQTFPLTPDKLAAAGFYSSPIPSCPDRCVCFGCGLTLNSWARSDDPLLQHLRWRSDPASAPRAKYPGAGDWQLSNTMCARKDTRSPSASRSVAAKASLFLPLFSERLLRRVPP